MGNRYGGANLLMGGNLDESSSLRIQPRKPASKQRTQVGSINEKLLVLLALLSTTAQSNAHLAHISCKYNFKNTHSYIEKGEHTFSINPLEESITWTDESSRFRPQSKGELVTAENPY
jgi:hypothetical protein